MTHQFLKKTSNLSFSGISAGNVLSDGRGSPCITQTTLHDDTKSPAHFYFFDFLNRTNTPLKVILRWKTSELVKNIELGKTNL